MEKSMVAKLILDASSYKQGIDLAKQATVSINKELELWKAQNKAVEGSAKTLAKQLDMQKSQQQVLAAEMTQTIKKYNDVINVQGEDSKAAMNLKNKILDLQSQQAKLNNEIQNASKPFTNFKNHLNDVAKGLKEAGDKMISVGKSLTMSVTVPLVSIGTAATKMAMDAIESENLFEVSMEDMAESARKWSQDLRDNLGLNEYAVRKNVATFNVMFDSMGMGTKASYNMATGLTQLSYDMASFYNLKPEEAFRKLQAGISGEIEPLKRLGIVVNETTTKTYAYTHGIAKQGETLNEQQKILARYGVIMDATNKAQGDLARTIDSPINQLRLMGEQAQQLGVDFGMALIPVLKEGIDIIRPMIDRIKEWTDAFRKLAPEKQQTIIKIGLLVAAIGPALMIIGSMAKGISALTIGVKAAVTVFGAIKTAIAAFGATTSASMLPVVAIIAGVTALAAGAYLLIKNWDKAVPFFDSVWKLIKSAFVTGGSAIMIAVREIQLGLAKFLDFTAGNLLALYSGLFGFMSKIPGIGGVFKVAQEGINGLRDTLKGFVSSSETDLDTAKTNLKSAASGTAEAWETMTQAASELGKGMGNTIQESVNKVKSMFGGLTSTSKNAAKDVKATAPEYATAGKVLGDALADGIKLGGEEAAKAAREAAEKAKKEMIGNINSLNSAVLSALRRRYDAQKKLDESALDAETKNLEKWKNTQLKYVNDIYDKTISALDKETREKIDAIETQIDAIDAQKEAENEARQNKEELDSIASLRAKIAATTDADEMISIQNDLNEAIESRARRLHENELESLKESLRSQVEAIRTAAEDKKSQLEADLKSQQENLQSQYTNEKENLDKRKANIDEFYSNVTSAASMAAETQKLIMGQNQKEIAELLKTYGNEYEDSGKSLGERFFEGFKTWADQIAELIKNASGGVTVPSQGATGYTPTGSEGVDALLSEMEANSKAWGDATAEEKEKLHLENIELASKIASETGTAPVFNSASGKWDVLQYANGTNSASPGWALVGEKGPELLKFSGGESVISNNKIKESMSSLTQPVIQLVFNSSVYGMLDFEQKVKQTIKDAARSGAFRGVLTNA